MKHQYALNATILLTMLSTTAMAAQKRKENPVDLMPDASSAMYQRERAQHAALNANPDDQEFGQEVGVTDALRFGKRNLDWLNQINAHRGSLPPISFTSRSTATGVPITAPKRYNAIIVERDLNAVRASAAKAYADVIFGGAPLTNELPLPEAEYIAIGRAMDKVYQTASRWTLVKPYLWQYAMMERDDIRGFYFLEREEDLSSKLANFVSLEPTKQNELRGYLESLCYNGGGSKSSCKSEVAAAAGANTLQSYFTEHREAGAERFSELYNLNVKRDDLQWSGNEAHLSFLDPGTTEVQNFLKLNLEDEWKWTTGNQTWNLFIDFNGSSRSSPYVTFAAGATPHVDGLGGNHITMDANAPLTEYEVQWTIRHEFGHVLGFPDCYVEFYDSAASEMVNYQIDTTDLMCSRTGHMKERLYTQLRDTYTR